MWKGGFRVPYLVRWPGRVPAGTVCEETISLVDTLASLAAITGTKLPDASEAVEKQAAEDNHVVSRAWLGQPHSSPIRPDVIVHSADGNFAIRRGSWKWIEGVPAADVKAALKKARADQMHRQLFDLRADIGETRELSQQHADVAKELEALLNRYRDGGYSRALPPVVVRPPQRAVELPPQTGEKLIELPLDRLPGKPWTTAGGEWTARDGAIWTTASDKGSSLTGPLNLQDGVIEFQLRLGDANRHSLRLHTAGNTHSFRIVLSRTSLDIARNPPRGEPASNLVPLARQRVQFNANDWQTVRVSFMATRRRPKLRASRPRPKTRSLPRSNRNCTSLPSRGKSVCAIWSLRIRPPNFFTHELAALQSEGFCRSTAEGCSAISPTAAPAGL